MGEPPPEDPPLHAVRARIDAIDDQILALVGERAALSSSVARAKQAAGETRFALRPERETQILRRLLASKGLAVSDEMVIGLWRQIIADSLARQGPVHIALWGGRSLARTLELARIRFGAGVPVRGAARPEDALAGTRTPGGIAVLALAAEAPWWGRLLAEPTLNVFASLPDLARWGPHTALAVAQVQVEPSGHDETFWVTDAPQQPSVIVEHLGRIGFAAELIADVGGLRLFSLAGYIQREDGRLTQAPGRLKGVIGAASLPLDV